MNRGNKIKPLGRKVGPRKALLKGLVRSLVMYKRMITTFAKAQAVHRAIAPLLTKSKKDITHNRRLIFSKLQDKHAVKEIFENIAPKIKSRNGGYTRVIKLANRGKGDGRRNAMIELVDFNTIYQRKGSTITKRRRRRKKNNTPIIPVEATALEKTANKKESNIALVQEKNSKLSKPTEKSISTAPNKEIKEKKEPK